MRVKSESRRQSIIDVAAEAFREQGFDATSMSDVASRVGGSKATLYNYFPSKEALFIAVMLDAAKTEGGAIFESFLEDPEVGSAVRRFAFDYIRFMIQPEILSIARMCVAQGERTGVGADFYEQGPKIVWTKVAERLRREMELGRLFSADPWRAAMHLKGLCEAGMVDRRMRGCMGDPHPDELQAHALAAAEAFLRAYRPV